MRLLIDAGNTRLKLALEEQGRFIDTQSFLLADLKVSADEYFKRVGETYQLDEVLVSLVSSPEVGEVISQMSHRHFHVTCRFARVEKVFKGITVAYENVRNLGVDRWLAMLAAWRKKRTSSVIIDAGSAITVDYISSEGAHIGGLIVPGIGLMRKALFNETSSVKVGALDLPQEWRPGRDTLPCVANGLSAMIKGFLSEVTESQQNMRVLLTGGDAETISPLIHAKTEIHQNLVLEGLVCVG